MTDAGAHKTTNARSRNRVAWVIVLSGSLLAGYAVSGEYLYHGVIGLDSSAFPAGEWVQKNLAPDAPNAVGGGVAAFVTLLGISVTGGLLFGWLARGPAGAGKRSNASAVAIGDANAEARA